MENYKSENKINYIFLATAIVIILMILSLSLNAFYLGGDDYNLLTDLKQNGIFKNCFNGYFDWDGRQLSIGSFFQSFCLVYIPVKMIIFIWSLCFLISGILIYKIIALEINLTFLTKEKKLIILITLPIILWYGSFKHLPETVYWATGGAYSFGLLLGSIWVIGYLLWQKNKLNLFNKSCFVIFSLITSATTENMSFALITLVLITLFVAFLKKEKVNWYTYLILSALIIGLLFIALAPGNFIRLKAVNHIKSYDFVIIYVIKNFIIILTHYVIWASFLFLLSFLLGFVIVFLICPNRKLVLKFRFYKLKTKENWLLFLNDTKWLWVAVSTTTPVVIVPELNSVRTSIYFMFFMMIFIVIYTIKTIFRLSVKSNDINIKRKNLMYYTLIISIIFISCMVFVSYNFYKGFQLNKAITLRETILKNGRNKTVYLKLIDPNINNGLYKFTDFVTSGKENMDWIKEGQEKYYKTKIVVIE